MKLQIDTKTIPAILFFVVAMGLLMASVRTTTLAEKAAEEARNGLIPIEKAPAAIDFSLPVVSGQSDGVPSTVTLLSAAKNTPVIFSFWAGYCQYCPMEMTNLEKYAQQYKGKIQIYTVNSNDEPGYIRKYMAFHKFTLPVLLDESHQVAGKYGVDGLPTLIAVDRDGRIRYVSNGFDPQMDTVFPRILNALIKQG
jgi:thiol-disulfide isomerase/thioredoxin